MIQKNAENFGEPIVRDDGIQLMKSQCWRVRMLPRKARMPTREERKVPESASLTLPTASDGRRWKVSRRRHTRVNSRVGLAHLTEVRRC